MAQASAKFYAYMKAEWVLLDDVQPINGQWGISSNKPMDRLADIGTLTLALNNKTGLYSPDGPSALVGWKKGVPFKMVITFNGVEYIRFRGAVSEIKIKPTLKDPKAYITVLDWLDYAARYPIPNPVLLENASTDEAITEIVSNMPIAPQAVRYDVGTSIYPTVFDSVKDFTTGYAEFGKLALSELGYVYLRKEQANGEVLVFEANGARNGLRPLTGITTATLDGYLLMENGSYLLTEAGDKIILGTVTATTLDNSVMSYDASYGENLINRVVASAYPKRIDTTAVNVYALEKPLYIAAGETKTFKAKYSNPQGGNAINALAPAQNVTTKSLLHFDGLISKYTVEDETGKKWTTHSYDAVTNVVKIGKASGYFDGGGSWIESPDSPDWDLGTSDFTIEWWEYRFNVTSGRCVTSRDYAAAKPAFLLGYSNGTNSLVYLSSDGANWDIANAESFGAPTIAVWEHYALVREGSNFRMYKNGVEVNTFTSAAALNPSSAVMSIGRNGATYITACIDEFRFETRAVYTSAFTPAKEPYFLLGTFAALYTDTLEAGTNLTGSMSLTTSYFTNGAEFTITNNSASAGYITRLKTYALGIYSFSSIDYSTESSASINEFGHESENIGQPYKQDMDNGKIEADKILNINSQPRTVLNTVRMSANKSDEAMLQFLLNDIGDLVYIGIDEAGIEAYYYIQGISVEMNSGLINYSWVVMEANSVRVGLRALEIQFNTGSEDAINYGYLPAVSGDAVTVRTFSTWIKTTAWDDGAGGAIMGTLNIIEISPLQLGQGQGIILEKTFGDTILSFYSLRYGVGKWTATGVVPEEEWVHILIYHDLTNVDNAPVLYVNGSLETLTEDVTPTGVETTEVGATLVVGNILSAFGVPYPLQFDGTIKDARVYTGTLDHAALAAALYAEGAYGYDNTAGMVFIAGYCRTVDQAAYDGTVLTAAEKVLDGFNGYIGTPHGSPTSNLI